MVSISVSVMSDLLMANSIKKKEKSSQSDFISNIEFYITNPTLKDKTYTYATHTT